MTQKTDKDKLDKQREIAQLLRKYNSKDTIQESKEIREARQKEIFITMFTLFLSARVCYALEVEKDPRYINMRFNDVMQSISAENRLFEDFKSVLSPFDAIQGLEVMLSQNYKSPENAGTVLRHLDLLNRYYLNYRYYVIPSNFPLTPADLRLDFVCSKLLSQALKMSYGYKKRGELKRRITKSTSKKKINKEKKKQATLETFYRMNTANVSLHKIAKTIEKKLIAEGIYPEPKLGEKPKDRTKSIKRYLLEENKTEKNLEKKGISNRQT